MKRKQENTRLLPCLSFVLNVGRIQRLPPLSPPPFSPFFFSYFVRFSFFSLIGEKILRPSLRKNNQNLPSFEISAVHYKTGDSRGVKSQTDASSKKFSCKNSL